MEALFLSSTVLMSGLVETSSGCTQGCIKNKIYLKYIVLKIVMKEIKLAKFLIFLLVKYLLPFGRKVGQCL